MNQIPNMFWSLIIRIWILLVICELVLGILSIQGAWNFVNSKPQLGLNILYDFCNKFVPHDTRPCCTSP
jgi:hypothetical protein